MSCQTINELESVFIENRRKRNKYVCVEHLIDGWIDAFVRVSIQRNSTKTKGTMELMKPGKINRKKMDKATFEWAVSITTLIEICVFGIDMMPHTKRKNKNSLFFLFFFKLNFTFAFDEMQKAQWFMFIVMQLTMMPTMVHRLANVSTKQDEKMNQRRVHESLLFYCSRARRKKAPFFHLFYCLKWNMSNNNEFFSLL